MDALGTGSKPCLLLTAANERDQGASFPDVKATHSFGSVDLVCRKRRIIEAQFFDSMNAYAFLISFSSDELALD